MLKICNSHISMGTSHAYSNLKDSPTFPRSHISISSQRSEKVLSHEHPAFCMGFRVLVPGMEDLSKDMILYQVKMWLI